MEAIVEGMQLEFGQALTTEAVDFLKDYAPPPYNHLPRFYPDMVRVPELWGVGYRISDGRPQARLITSTLWPIVRRAARRLVKQHPADLLVSVHPLANSFFLKALGKNRPPFVTVVTDMVSTHALWFDKRADLILVPTSMAAASALENHMDPKKVLVAGQPISQWHCQVDCDKKSLREKLGYPEGKPTILLVGGGDGMGPLVETAAALDGCGMDMNLVIVTGRNTQLKEQLESMSWSRPPIIHGFTREMPLLMRAADVLISKAGPGTIAEALAAGLPIILFARLNGQEDGNVKYVEASGVGVWAPSPPEVISALRRWVDHPDEYARVVQNCTNSARPEAARVIARLLGEKIGLKNAVV